MCRFVDTVLFLVGSAYFVAGSYDESDAAPGAVGSLVCDVYVLMYVMCTMTGMYRGMYIECDVLVFCDLYIYICG